MGTVTTFPLTTVVLSKTGNSATIVSGTAGIAGNLASWTADGNAADSGVAISIDGTLAGNSDTDLPTEKAVKTYIDAPHAADRTALAALNGSVHPVAFLREARREGLFVWTAGDLSAYVTADTQQGIYVAHATVASTVGAWVRIRTSPNYFHGAWFGMVENSNCQAALAGCISILTALRGATSLTLQNATSASIIEFPAGYFTCSERVTCTVPGVTFRGAGEGGTIFDITTSITGCFLVRAADYLNGQQLDNIVFEEFQIRRNSTAYNSADIGIEGVLLRRSYIRNVLFTNLSRSISLAAPQIFWITTCSINQRNTLLTGNVSDDIMITSQIVNAGTQGADIDPDTAVQRIHGAMCFIRGVNFSNPTSGTTRSNIYLQTIDGLHVSDTHMGGSQWQLYVDSPSATTPISNTVFSNVMFDGVPAQTERNVYIAPKTYVSANAALHIAFNRCKFNGSNSSAIRLAHVDWQEFELHGGEIDKASGNYGIHVTGGNSTYGLLDIQHVKFRINGGGPDLASVFLDTTTGTFFKMTRIKNGIFYAGDSTTLPARHVWLAGNGTNNGSKVVLTENDYLTSAALTSGFFQNGDTGTIVVVNRDNTSFT